MKIENNSLEILGKEVFMLPFSKNDITDRYLSWLNDTEVVSYSNQRFINHTYDSSLNYLNGFSNSKNKFFSINKLNNKKMIGTMTAYESTNHGVVDIGIMIGDKSVWGKGYGQDAWSTILEWYAQRKDIRKITAGTLACNHGMIRLMERSGMKLEATKKKQEIVDGLPEDILYYSKFSNV